MLRRLRLCLPLLAACAATSARAAQGLVHIAVEGNLGATSFSGDLSAKAAAPTYGLTVALGHVVWQNGGANLGGLASFWSLNINFIDSKTKAATSFPFLPQQTFNVAATSFSPNICALADFPVQACIGLGWEEFDVHQGSDNEQMYGTGMWSLAVGRFLNDGLHAGLKVNYRRVDQTVNKLKSNFAATSVLLSLGWQFRS